MIVANGLSKKVVKKFTVAEIRILDGHVKGQKCGEGKLLWTFFRLSNY